MRGDVYVAPGLPYGNRRRWSELEGPQESAWRSSQLNKGEQIRN